jgi:hypothetical protein
MIPHCVSVAFYFAFLLSLPLSMAYRTAGLIDEFVHFLGERGKTKDDTTGSCASRDMEGWNWSVVHKVYEL